MQSTISTSHRQQESLDVAKPFADLFASSFGWGGRWQAEGDSIDCYGLAIEARKRLLPTASPLPDYGWIYEQYSRETFPQKIILSIIRCDGRARAVHDPEPGDLVLTNGPRGVAMGTYIGESLILLIGEQGPEAVHSAVASLIGYWRVA
jgi:hypothetical protein